MVDGGWWMMDGGSVPMILTPALAFPMIEDPVRGSDGYSSSAMDDGFRAQPYAADS
jgi:hypothetical protein